MGAGIMASAVAPAAAQAADPPVVTGAHSDYDNNAYDTLVVSARSGSDITAITAHVLDPSTRAEVASTGAFTLRSGTATDGVWAGVPLVLDAVGEYVVDVEVTDADGHHVRTDGIGSLNYAVASYFDGVTLDRTATTYEHRSVTVRGKLLGRYPGTHEIIPVGGVYLVVYGLANYGEATTEADGSFTAEVTIAYESEFLQAIFNSSSVGLISSTSDTYPVTIKPRPVRVTVAVDRTRIDYGQTVTAAGRITWRAGGRWVPMPNVTAFVLRCTQPDVDHCDYIASVVTGGDGRFTYTYAPSAGTYIGVSHFEYTADGGVDPYVQAGFGASKLVIVDQPSAFSDFTAARDSEGLIAVHGRFGFTNRQAPAHFDVQLQYSADGVDGWQTYQTFTDQWEFGVTGVSMPQTVSWRAVYPGELGWQRTVSEVISVPAL
ncbi:hypothetical protein [Paractinoplanes durhamensis]|uniref:hypothetical protein n=1 Tax=Paractinoplanes durhamensis TaxID=113563 RepID=UPI0019416FD9|nr:hypothetical protein [Actinoplanes durhamensis]